MRSIKLQEKRKPGATGSGAWLENQRGVIESGQMTGCDLHQGLGGWPGNQSACIHFESMAPKPGFTHQVLDRLVQRCSTHPVPKGLTFRIGRHPIRLHVEAKPLTSDGCGDHQFGRHSGGIDASTLQVIPNPLQEASRRPW